MKGIDKMKNIKYFLLFAEGLTGRPKEQIKIINFEIDPKGLCSGIIEIDGIREYIHEYI